MAVATFDFTLTGRTSLLMHADDVESAMELIEWRKDEGAKGAKGSDFCPPWTWLTYTYRDAGLVVIPSRVLRSSMRSGGSAVRKPTGTATYKKESQSAVVFAADVCEFRTARGDQVDLTPFIVAKDNWEFADHKAAAAAAGFRLHVIRAKIGAAKHIRIRPEFGPGWTVRGQITVDTDELPAPVLRKVFAAAGRLGIGDWRPGSPASGDYGQYDTELSQVD